MACLKTSAVLMLLVAGLLDLNPTVAGSIERSSEYSLRDASDGLVSINVDAIEPSLSSSTRHGKCKRKRVNTHLSSPMAICTFLCAGRSTFRCRLPRSANQIRDEITN